MKKDNWIKEIANAPKVMKYSQNGEEGILKFILDNVGPGEQKFFVDMGAGDGYDLSNTRIFKEYYGYQGLFFDGRTVEAPDVITAWITLESVLGLLEQNKCPLQFSLLSLDLDGNDFDILHKILQVYQPRVVVCEINGTIPAGVSVKMKYNAEHVWQGGDHYGFSYDACAKLAEMCGYKIVHHTDATNVYMVRADLLQPSTEIQLPEFKHNPYHAHDSSKEGEWVEVN